ncbi:2-oxoglutarate dehydrogenase-like, mitochondrial [Zophobas morio]|uniref:2-oxoglutarate dehydrogenase-like, mitochondrial n=1 Tax=Zophobas morio TaxID=2755281 RepID=UPI00308359E4
MYISWKKDPSSVHKSWDIYFKNVENGNMKNAFCLPPSLDNRAALRKEMPCGSSDTLRAAKEYASILSLIRAYQVRGHLMANLDPLGISNNALCDEKFDECNYKTYCFSEADLDREFYIQDENMGGALSFFGFGEQQKATLRTILERLKEIYCNTIGWEFMHINDREKCDWLRREIEFPGNMSVSREEKKVILRRLNQADGFENFLQTKWGSEKRFGIEGLESTIVCVKGIIDKASELGVEAIVLGMPHRGRLNVLGNVLKKPLESLFSEFDSHLQPTEEGSGDVKYHLGSSSDRLTRSGHKIHLSLVANPSHLEAVNPVVLGKVRAEQFYRNDHQRQRVVPLLLHGDASFSGQGVVYECLNMSDLPNYSTGGTLHVICNNQIGFTTDPRFSRSSPYCTDVAKSLQAPIFHVNADDAEAVLKVSELAIKWRQKWGEDVVIDIIGYRRHGHNEGDNPAFTQPMMYKAIAKHSPVEKMYKERLLKEGVICEKEYRKLDEDYQRLCKEAFEKSKNEKIRIDDWLDSRWKGFKAPRNMSLARDTGVSIERLKHIGTVISTVPKGFTSHRGVDRILKARMQTVKSGSGIDWATAEALAFGTLLMEKFHVRLSGQDVERGTFCQRHHVLHDQNTEETYVPLNHLLDEQAKYTVSNSSLSEYGILGFELGYSYANPNSLICWEAQFGDFVNGAQIIIDQFLSSGEQKWLRQSGLTLFLPHGYEGMGPEHSSARLERFLQACDDNCEVFPDNLSAKRQIQQCNWQVLNCSTPANLFHALRRQCHRDFRKPLILITPKSLLRLEACTSSLKEMAEGTRFERLLFEKKSSDSFRKVIFCTGKVKYTLMEARKEAGLENEIAIASVEQIAPFPFDLVKQQVEKFPSASIVWCQEEPKNMGAWSYVKPRIWTSLKNSSTHKDCHPTYVGRPPSAATATGVKSQHYKEEKNFLNEAMS